MASELEAMFMGEGDGVDSAEEEMTARQVLDELQEAWANEKLSPELLPHKAELVQVMMEQVEQMETNVKQLSRTDLRSTVHRQELERIKYLIKSYLRTRIAKIETYCLYLLRCLQQQQNDSGSSQRSLAHPGQALSEEEMKYLREYATNTAAHLRIVLDYLPYPMNQFNAREMEAEPDLECHVFAQSKVDLPESLLVSSSDDAAGTEEEVTLRVGSQHVIPYSTIRHLVHSSQVILI